MKAPRSEAGGGFFFRQYTCVRERNAEHRRGTSDDSSLTREEEHCKIKRVNPPFRFRVHSAGTKGLPADEVGYPERRALIVSGRFRAAIPRSAGELGIEVMEDRPGRIHDQHRLVLLEERRIRVATLARFLTGFNASRMAPIERSTWVMSWARGPAF